MALWHDHLTPYNNSRNNVVDRRFAQSTYVNAPKVIRGRIENIDLSSGRVVAEKKHVFHFLMNPSQLDLSYNVNSQVDLTDPANYASVMSGIPPMRDGLLGVSFEMLLDRTYEVWSGSLPEGVLHDIAQLEKVLGMPDQVAKSNGGDRIPAAVLDSPSNVVSAEGPSTIFPGVIIKRPIRILFGSKNAFSFDGYIESLSITLMKFNKNMCATRAGINISATSWGDREDAGGGGIGTGYWTNRVGAVTGTHTPGQHTAPGTRQQPGGFS